MDTRPENYGRLWTRDELILAFDLYCRIPFQKTKTSNPEVCQLAELLRRSPAAIARKLGNLGAFDPELKRRNISGLGHGGKLDREIWDEFHSDWNGLVSEAHRLRIELLTRTEQGPTPTSHQPPQGPSERTTVTRQRIHQSFFRAAVLSSYDSTCCVTGIRTPECLIAGHIVPWSVEERYRTDPTNGLCMTATFDRLFDSGLMTVTGDMTVRLSKRILDSTDRKTLDLLAVYEGRQILLPLRFVPSQDRLNWHRENMFIA